MVKKPLKELKISRALDQYPSQLKRLQKSILPTSSDDAVKLNTNDLEMSNHHY
jgi:hypothetical protein